MFSDYYIFNGGIYLSEDQFDFYQGDYVASTRLNEDFGVRTLDKNNFILVAPSFNSYKAAVANYSCNTSLTMFFDEKMIPTVKESGDQMNNISKKVDKVFYADGVVNADAVVEKYIFFISLSDLFDNDNKLIKEINVKNNNLILNSDLDFKKCNNF